MRKMLTLIKKEIIENRGSIVWLPVVVAGLLMISLITSLIWHGELAFQLNSQGILAINSLEAEQRQQLASAILTALSIPFFLPLLLVTLFYLAHALFDDRKDRSILFWKSLPISDRMTVSSKLIMAMAVIPVVYLVSLLVTQLVTLSALSWYGLSEGINLWAVLWSPGLILTHATTTLTALLVHGFWMLPVYAWLLLCSSFAPRSPLMVAIAIPAILSLAAGLWRVLEMGQWSAFNPMKWLGQRFSDSPLPMNVLVTLDPSPTVESQITTLAELLQYLSSTWMWLGWLVALPMLVATIYIRHRATA